tara:strand:- start:37 stop:303 length:267 start_codon:yes stop_codon:yes gene_type:complete
MDFQEDLELFNQAMNNAYLLVTNRIDMKHIYKVLDKGIDNFSLPFDPTKHDGKSEDIIDMLIEHFVSTEEYEKCSELTKIKLTIGKKV